MTHLRTLLTCATMVATVLASAGTAAAATSLTKQGALRVNGARTFPISVSYGPSFKWDRHTQTWLVPDGMDRLVADGVDGFKFRPPYTPTHEPWSHNNAATLAAAHAFDALAARYGVFTEVNLCQFCGRAPKPMLSGRTIGGSLLASVSRALAGDAGFGLYKGPDEPFLNGVRPRMIAPGFHATQTTDPSHLWATLQAGGSDRYAGTAFWRPYAGVTNIAGAGRFPLKANPAKSTPIDTVGKITAMARAAQPNGAVWTTLQLCAAGVHAYTDAVTGVSYNTATPTAAQYRFMVWDAIINGARGINFFGGHMKGCWTAADAARGWDWHAWYRVSPTVRKVRSMNASLTGIRRRLHLARPWEGVTLYGGLHPIIVKADTHTHRVVIGAS